MRLIVPTTEMRDALASALPSGVDIDVWDYTSPAPRGHVDLAVLPYMARPTVLDALQGVDVAWVQGQALGYDGMADHLPEGVGFSNAVGVHEASTAELTLALVLVAERDIPRYVQQQERHEWNQTTAPGLLERTALVVGVGGVGSAIAHLLRAFGMTVLRSASRAREDEFGPIGGPDDLPGQLSQADVVVLATPLTDATRHLADADFLQRMRQGALLVNIGRGPLVDSDALVAAASEGRVRAALDVKIGRAHV